MIKNDNRWKQFCEIHSRELVPFFNAFEVKRRRTAPWVMLCEIISNLLFFFFFFTPFIASFAKRTDLVNKYEYLYILAFIIFAILNLIVRNQKNKFKLILKNNCMEKVLKVFGNINYENCADTENPISCLGISSSIKDDVLRNSMLFGAYNKRRDDDLFYGNYDNVDFQILETRLLHESRSSKKKSTTLVFKGIISFFTSNKNFSGQTIIATRGDRLGTPTPIWLILLILAPFVAIGGALIYSEPTVLEHWVLFIVPIFILLLAFASCKNKPKLEEIKLEDPEIRKNFVVYSTDQVEARYLLTPSFMQRFKRLKTAYGTKKIKCSFFDNKVMFAISAKKDLFEIGHLYKSLHDPQAIYALYNEIASIQAMIKHFKFDEKTGI